MAALLSPAYFLVEGQISRQGWRFTVSVASLRFWPTFENCALRSLTVVFSSSDVTRRLCKVALMSLLPESSAVSFCAFFKVCRAHCRCR